MTATLDPRALPARTSSLPDLKVTQGRVLDAEWTKFRSLRSTYITLATTVVLIVGISALISAVQANHWPHATASDRAGFNAVSTSLNGITFGELAIGVLGVLLFSGEYSTGSIRATLTAVPTRLPVLWAKLGLYAAVTAVVAFISSFVAFFVGQALLSSQHIQASLSSPGALRMVVGSALFLIVVGVMGLSLGAILRNTAAGISSLVALFFVLPVIFEALPKSFSKHFTPYLPYNSGAALWTHPDTAHLSPWAGFAVMCAWALAGVVAAAVLLRRRDA
jgi:ABC-type transport system involved in multi-copper enzyme maturation permease subunit